MSNDEKIDAAKSGIALVGEIIKMAGDNPKAKEAASNIGQTAVTLTRTINNILVPLAAINFAFEKARVYFENKFPQDIEEKTKSIPLEYAAEPKASIAGPTLQGLAFSHEEPNLKEMYLNLLATSMDQRTSDISHPAFVEVIKQLDSEDAELINDILRGTSVPIVQIQRNLPNGAYSILASHIMSLVSSENDQPIETPNLPAMVDNWIRLGLVEVNYTKHIHDVSRYSWAEDRPEYLKIKENSKDGESYAIKKGIMERTSFGTRFAKAVGII